MTGVIYDFGMNNGDDVEYYLKKGMRVVAVEANPTLCELATYRFPAEIADGRLAILNVALTETASRLDGDCVTGPRGLLPSQGQPRSQPVDEA